MAVRYVYNNQKYNSLYQLRQIIWEQENILYGDPKTQEEFDAEPLLKGKVVVEEYEPLEELSIEILRKKCKSGMNRVFQEYRSSSKTFITSSLGFPVNANDEAYQNIDGCIRQAKRGASTLDDEGRVAFSDFNDTLQMLTAEEIEKLALEVSENGSRAYGVKWLYREQIDATEDKQTLIGWIKTSPWDFRPEDQKKAEA